MDGLIMSDFWIIVHPDVKEVGGRIAVKIRHIITVREKTDSRFAIIDFDDGTSLVTKESFDEIWAMIR